MEEFYLDQSFKISQPGGPVVKTQCSQCSLKTKIPHIMQHGQNIKIKQLSVQFSHVQFSVTPWTIVRQASLSITNSRSLFKLMSMELVMPSNHLILCRPLLSPLIFPSISVFSSESVPHIRWPKYWSSSFSISPSRQD